MSDVKGFLKKAAEKCGFNRICYNERNIPVDPVNICVVPFFGDFRSLFVMSSLILNRFREEDKASKYLIFCSWPGFKVLFPYVDEYWEIGNEDSLQRLYYNASKFDNNNGHLSTYFRNINQYFFEDVIPGEEFSKFYNNGITDEFWNKYKVIKRALPEIPSSAILGKEFNNELNKRGGYKVFLYPSVYLQSWKLNSITQIAASKDFWVYLVKRLLDDKFMPVIYKGPLTHDLSSVFLNNCLYTNESDMGKVFSTMRVTGCVLDVFTGISRFALAARCPFIAVDERSRYTKLREYEIDDLCAPTLPKQYIFSFPTIIGGGNDLVWGYNLVDNIMTRLNSFLPLLDREEWPSTGSSTEIIDYAIVRKKKIKRLGVRFFSRSKE